VADCNGDGQAGLFLLRPDAAEPRHMAEAGGALDWDEDLGWFVVRDREGAALYVTPDGRVVDPAAGVEALLHELPEGKRWAWRAEDGTLWAGARDEAPRQVFVGEAFNWRWSPDFQGLFFASGEPGASSLYAARAPGFAPALVGQGLPAQAIWVR
jgi:hypothetical protein